MPGFFDLSFLYSSGFSVPNMEGVYEIPFVDRMGIVFAIWVIGMYFISIYEINKGVQTQGLEVDASMFKTSTGFMVGSIIIIGILAALYTVFW